MESSIINSKKLIALIIMFVWFPVLRGNICLEMYGNSKQAKEWELGPLKNLDSVQFTVYDYRNNETGRYYSNKAGICFFKLNINKMYEIRVSKKGWVTKIIKVDTRIHDGPEKNYRLPFEIDMFEDIPELDVSVLKEPIAYVVFNPYLICFDYNFDYTDEVNAALKKLYSDYYRLRLKYKPAANNSGRLNHVSAISPGNKNSNTSVVDSGISVMKGERIFRDGSTDHFNGIIGNKSLPSDAWVAFKVQILSLSAHLPDEAKIFRKCQSKVISEYIFNSEYKYTVGEYRTLDEAKNALAKVRSMGYNDAFIVFFINGQRVLNYNLEELATFYNRH